MKIICVTRQTIKLTLPNIIKIHPPILKNNKNLIFFDYSLHNCTALMKKEPGKMNPIRFATVAPMKPKTI